MAMEYGPSDSSGTDDDLPPSHQSRSARGGRITGIVGGLPHPRLQTDMQSQIHGLEQEAYSAVLRAFKAQADAITWEKEGLITELRKELRISNEEHRELLSRVNADDIIRRIREWRQSGGLQSDLLNNAQHNHDIAPSPTVSASRKRQKTSPSVPIGAPSSALLSQTIGAPLQTSSSTAKRGAPGLRGKKLKSGQSIPGASSVKPGQYTVTGMSGRGLAANRNSSAIMAARDPVEPAPYDPLIGRKVMTRWPDDNNFYEAIIKDYDEAKGTHLFVYDMNTPNETWEWVNLKEISREDIRWEGEDPGINQRGGRGGPGRGYKKSAGRGGRTSGVGRGRGFLKSHPRKDLLPLQNGIGRNGMDDVEIMNTDILIKEVEKVFNAAHPDPLQIENAKKLLKDHEQSLVDAIARLAEASDGERDGEHHFSHGQFTDRDGRWKQKFTSRHGANYADDMADGGREGSDGEHDTGSHMVMMV